jgi:hypothetical protein
VSELREVEALEAIASQLQHYASKAYPTARTSANAAAIMAGAAFKDDAPSFGDNYRGARFLQNLVDARRGDPEAGQYVKAVLGTSSATGQAIIPNNFIGEIVARTSAGNVYRQICTGRRPRACGDGVADEPPTMTIMAAWDAVHEALPARWCVGRPSFDPGTVRPDGYRGAVRHRSRTAPWTRQDAANRLRDGD